MKAVAVAALCFSALACNRASMRIYGASLSFPSTSTGYKATQGYPFRVVVAMPTDRRADHYGEKVAGTDWTGCDTDPFSAGEAQSLIRDRLAAALAESGLFKSVSKETPIAGDLVVRSEIDAFCSQAYGFIILRVAGITAIKITIERDGHPLFEQKFERVVTDADPQYTGSQVTFIEEAMKVTMADSLRELMHDFLAAIARNAGNWSRG